METVRVLLIDDDDPTRRFLQRLLQPYGVDIEPVPSFAAALDRLREHAYAAIISELSLVATPQQNLFEYLDQIRTLQPAAPIILLTRSGLPGLTETAYQSGIAFCFHKPVRRDVLLEALRSTRVFPPTRE